MDFAVIMGTTEELVVLRKGGWSKLYLPTRIDRDSGAAESELRKGGQKRRKKNPTRTDRDSGAVVSGVRGV